MSYFPWFNIYFFDTSSQSKRIKIMHCWILTWLAYFRVCTFYILLCEEESLGIIIPDYLCSVKVAQSLNTSFSLPKDFIKIWVVWVYSDFQRTLTLVCILKSEPCWYELICWDLIEKFLDNKVIIHKHQCLLFCAS